MVSFMEEMVTSSDWMKGSKTLHTTFSTAHLVYDINNIIALIFQATT